MLQGQHCDEEEQRIEEPAQAAERCFLCRQPAPEPGQEPGYNPASGKLTMALRQTGWLHHNHAANRHISGCLSHIDDRAKRILDLHGYAWNVRILPHLLIRVAVRSKFCD
jgi:hypothetical protein